MNFDGVVDKRKTDFEMSINLPWNPVEIEPVSMFWGTNNKTTNIRLKSIIEKIKNRKNNNKNGSSIFI